MTATLARSFTRPAEHLLAELDRLELLLKREVLRMRASNVLVEDDFRGLYIADEHVDAILDGATATGDGSVRAVDALAQRVCAENAVREHDSLPLVLLSRLFVLDAFERDVVLLAVAAEIDLRWETLFGYVQNDVTKRRPTVELALRLFCPSTDDRLARRATFAGDASLARNRLVALVEDQQEGDRPLLGRFLKVDDSLVDFLLGQNRPHLPSVRLDDLVLDRALRDALAATRAKLASGAAVLLHGDHGTGRRAIAEALAAELGFALVTADLSETLARADDSAVAAALLARDARLAGALVYVAGVELLADADPTLRGRAAAFLRELELAPGPLVFGATTPWDPALGLFRGRLAMIEVLPPAFTARRRLWQRALGPSAAGIDLDAVAGRYRLGAARILDAAREAATEPEPPSTAAVFAAARAQSSRALEQLAQQVEPVYGWDELVLPSAQMRALRDVCASVRYRHVVYERWGFDRKLAYGKGLNVLFSGASGTGKTMAAQIVARDLELDLYAIDLSSVVSKYIGETEQNLRRIFLAAHACNAILLFDEADALFGKRSEVRDAHDRYANIEVAYLLQQMEEYDGVVILATNLSKNIDEAFARRMDHTIEFPFPDEEHRERIWEVIFPRETPLADDVDFAFLAKRFELAGGNIRNVALAAAFRAAAAGCDIAMEDLIHATAREIDKLGRLPSRAAFGEHYELLLQRE